MRPAKNRVAFFKEYLFTNKSTWQTIVRNSLWLFLAEGLLKGTQFLIAILIARSYSVEQYGLFGFVFSIMTLIAMIGDFGLANITIRESAKNGAAQAKFHESAISFKALLVVVAAAVMIMVSFCLDADIRLLAILAGLAILFEGMTDYLRISFRIAEQTQYEVIIKAVTAIILLALVFSVIFLKLSLIFILAGYVIASFCGLLLTLRLVGRKLSISFSSLNIRFFFTESWPMFLGLVCTSVYGQIDLLLIKVFRGYAEAGLYQAAYRLMFAFQLVRVLHLAMFPRLATLFAEGDAEGYRRLIRKSIVWSIILLTPVGIISMVFPAEIIEVVFGQDYSSAAVALPFLIWSGILSFIASFFSNTLMISGQQRCWLILEFLVLTLLIIIEVSLIPRSGFIAAAIATFIGEVVFLILVVLKVRSCSFLRQLFFSGNQEKC